MPAADDIRGPARDRSQCRDDAHHGPERPLSSNQCCTAVYHSSVAGTKRKPAKSQRRDENIPSNQRVEAQRSATTSRGVTSARTTRKQGIGCE
jgi:hypothetical protein